MFDGFDADESSGRKRVGAEDDGGQRGIGVAFYWFVGLALAIVFNTNQPNRLSRNIYLLKSPHQVTAVWVEEMAAGLLSVSGLSLWALLYAPTGGGKPFGVSEGRCRDAAE